MTRTMGDATHANVPQLAATRGLQLAAGYVTGSADVVWTQADWVRFAAIQRVTIDQGAAGSPVATAMVRDVEPYAWTPAAAVDRTGWTAPRPTIYCDRNDLIRPGGVLASGWRGDLWLAFPGWQPGQPLPPAPGCTYVAVQNNYGNPAFDLSVVLDPTWPLPAAPKENDMAATLVYGQKTEYVLDGGRAHVVQSPADLTTYQAAVTAGQMNVIGGPTQGGRLLTTVEEAQFVKDFPAGNPAVTVPPLTVNPTPAMTGTITLTPTA